MKKLVIYEIVLEWLYCCDCDLNYDPIYVSDFEEAFKNRRKLPKVLIRELKQGVLSVFHEALLYYANILCARLDYTSVVTFPARYANHVESCGEVNEYRKLAHLYKYKHKVTIHCLRLRFAFIQKLNSILEKTLPVVDVR